MTAHTPFTPTLFHREAPQPGSPLHRAHHVVARLSDTVTQRDQNAGPPETEVQALRDAQLLDLIVPRTSGGQGAPWPDALEVVRVLSHDSGSLGQLYGNHLGLLIAPHLTGTPEQQARYDQGTAAHQWFWANAINTRDPRLQLTWTAGQARLHGVKGFGTGVSVADQCVFSAVAADTGTPVTFILPRGRAGVTPLGDWDHFGQRRTDSSTVQFQDVALHPHEILSAADPARPFSTFSGIISQATKTFVYLGIAEQALMATRTYLQRHAHPWGTSGVTQASADPYVLRHYAALWINVQSSLTLARQAAQSVQDAWARGDHLTAPERGEVAAEVFAAKASATQAGLQVSTHLFDLLGPRATATHFGFDRFWRDLRTFTLHDPVDYKLREVGDFLLNGTVPAISQYS